MRLENREERSFSILEIKSKNYVVCDGEGHLVLGRKEDRVLFYNEADVENVRMMLDEDMPGCYTIIIEGEEK